MEERGFRRRVALWAGLFFGLMLVFSGKLISLQVVHGADYAAAARQTLTTVETVAAARGEIYDRNGRLLAGNAVRYALSFDVDEMGDAKTETLQGLMTLCLREGIRWTDSLPIDWNSPNGYAEAGETASARFAEYLSRLGFGAEESAQLLVDRLSHHYGLPGELTPRTRRALLGLLYESDLRQMGLCWDAYVLAEVDGAFLAKLAEQGLPGVTGRPTATRRYETAAAAHVLGRVGPMSQSEWERYRDLGYAMDEVVGKDGAEQAFEDWMRPEKGQRTTARDGEGRILEREYTTQPVPGNSILLTLDLPLQEKAEAALAEAVATLPGAEGAAAAVLDVSDGGVLALVSHPGYALESFSADYEALAADPLRPLFHRALQGTYAPGSTFKLVTAIAALEEGLITPETQILDTGVYAYYETPRPRCWLFRETGLTHGLETVAEAIADSCNLFFYDVGRRLGIARLADYAAAFGLGQASGIELAGEAAGAVASPAYTESLGQQWYAGNVLSAAIGQENNRFTPLQLASYVATLCNGGTRMQVHLLREVRSFDLETSVEKTAPQILGTLDIAPENLAAVKEGMLAVTQTGAVARYFEGLSVSAGAKTGSAQVEGSEAANAVFVCFAPYENPEIAMAIVVEKGGSGAELAAVAAEILTFYFQEEADSTEIGPQELQNGENSR